MLLEDAQETVLIRERQMSVMSSPFTVYSEGNVPKSVMGYWLHKIYGWQSRREAAL
jgi:hypothetical protein